MHIEKNNMHIFSQSLFSFTKYKLPIESVMQFARYDIKSGNWQSLDDKQDISISLSAILVIPMYFDFFY